EGMELRLMAFLKVVKQETSGETCNCELHKLIDTDLHLVMVEHRHDLESDSVTAEITPRVRRLNHPNWSHTNIDKLQKKFVRLTKLSTADVEQFDNAIAVACMPHSEDRLENKLPARLPVKEYGVPDYFYRSDGCLVLSFDGGWYPFLDNTQGYNRGLLRWYV